MSKYDDVVENARELFTKYGYKKVSMDEIAKKACVTKKTIYTYFKDKQELFQHFIVEELDKMKEEIEKNYSKNELYIDKITDNLNLVLELSKNNEMIAKLIEERKGEDSLSNDFFRIYEKKILEYIEEKIQVEIDAGNIRATDAHLLAFMIYKLVFSMTFEYDKDINPEKISKEVTEVLKNGLLINKEGN